MNSWGRSREVEKPKRPAKVATLEVWTNPTTLDSKPGMYRARFSGTQADGYGETIPQAITDLFERLLMGAVHTAVAASHEERKGS